MATSYDKDDNVLGEFDNLEFPNNKAFWQRLQEEMEDEMVDKMLIRKKVIKDVATTSGEKLKKALKGS